MLMGGLLSWLLLLWPRWNQPSSTARGFVKGGAVFQKYLADARTGRQLKKSIFTLKPGHLLAEHDSLVNDIGHGLVLRDAVEPC
ncbi:hypothetical protein FB451DRAFT_1237544 [Mycena latifolia]|nr:hypothetical protein FB451DRAFT_1237544 [Mycena latifolia]